MKNLLFLFIILLASPAFADPFGMLLIQNAIKYPGSGAVGVLSIDGSVTGAPGTTSSGAVTLSTTKINDVIILDFKDGTGTESISSIADTAGLTWALRKKVGWGSGNANDAEEWYAVSSGILTSDVITVTYSASGGTNARITVYGVNGANTVTPFDPNAAVPAGVAGGSSSPITNTISTNKASDMIVTLFSTNTAVTYTRPAGFTQILATGSITDVAEEIVSSTQSSLAVTYTWTGSANFSSLITDVIQASGQ